MASIPELAIRFRNRARRFRGDRAGQFAIMTAITLPVLLAAAGLAVDYSNALRIKNQMQNAADIAVLAVTAEGRHQTEADAKAIAQRYLAGSDFRLEQVTVDGTEWTVRIGTSYQPYFGAFLKSDGFDMQVEARSSFNSARYEIALVLDTTGSMRGKKLADMKTAAIELVDGMTGGAKKGEPDDNGLRFSVVPFSAFVNVGPDYAPEVRSNGTLKDGAPWLDLYGRVPLEDHQRELPFGLSRFNLYKNMNRTWPGCVETRVPYGGNNYDVEDIEPDLSVPSQLLDPSYPSDRAKLHSLFVPTFYNDEPDRWLFRYANDYLTDGATSARKRLEKYGVPDATDLDPATFRNSTSIRRSSFSGQPIGPGLLCTSKPLQRLTDNFDDVRAKINELEAEGSTNILEGVMWGWRTLSHKKPFADGSQPDDDEVHKVMIVLTDGKNEPMLVGTSYAWNSMYSSIGFLKDRRFFSQETRTTDQVKTLFDEKTEQACTNAKATGIEVYTILLEEDDNATSRLLANCATTEEHHYFNAPSSTQLRGIFDSIKNRLQGVVLTG